MKSAVYFSFLTRILSLGVVLGGIPLSKFKEIKSQFVPNKFIIEVGKLSDIPERRSFERSLDVVYASLSARDVDYEVTKEYDVEGIFVGAALSLKTAEDVEALQNSPGIISIHPVRKYEQPKPVSIEIIKDFDPSRVPAAVVPHIITETDKVHAKGRAGKGSKVGVIDSGIDYNHPSLGGGFGPGFKVIGGYDFVGDSYTGANSPTPDSDPMDCGGHGTHVAGIIAALPNNQYNITGVAYGAELAGYRVFGCNGVTTDEIIIDALLLAVQDGMDVLNLSLGESSGWSDSPSSIVASRIAESGVVLAIAAGNQGAKGGWLSSAPANGVGVISIASSNNYVVAVQNITISGIEHPPIPYFQISTLPVEGVRPLYATSKDHTIVNDACNPLPDDTPDLSPYVVLVRRGSCTFVTKITNIAQKGANAALIYDNGNGIGRIEVGDFNAVLIRAEDGESLSKSLAAGSSISVEFPQGTSASILDPNGGEISAFTSYGPNYDLYLKPSLTAPGANILSTYPLARDGYALSSGTSMASPFFAGASALLLEARGKSVEVARSVREVFQTTGFLLPSSDTDGDPLVPASHQGAGLINVYKALYSKTVVSPAELLLNDTAHFKGSLTTTPSHTFSVTNGDSAAKEYKISHTPAGTAITIQKDSIFPILGVSPLVKDSATVEFDPATFTIQPGQSQTVSVKFTSPSGLDPRQLPVYSGFVEVESDTEKLHVTYLGVAAALKDQKVVDNTNYLFDEATPLLLGQSGEPQRLPTNYTFVEEDYPVLLWRLAFGSPSLRVDLVDSAIDFVPTLTTRDLLDPREEPIFSFPDSRISGSFAQVSTIGPLYARQLVCRNDEDLAGEAASTFYLQKPVFANGTVIENGMYRILFRVLRVSGDASNQADYESWLSPIFGIQVPA